MSELTTFEARRVTVTGKFAGESVLASPTFLQEISVELSNYLTTFGYLPGSITVKRTRVYGSIARFELTATPTADITSTLEDIIKSFENNKGIILYSVDEEEFVATA